MKVIILAAGYAVRLYPLTINTPKALLKVGKKSMLERQMEELETFGTDIDEVYIVTNDLFADKFEEFAKDYKGKLKITVLNDKTYSNETRLGAIGDTQFVIDKMNIDDEILLMVADNLFTFKLKDYYDYYRKVGTDTILGKVFPDNQLEYLGKNFGVAKVDANGQVISIKEKPGPNPGSNIGVYAFYFYTKDTVKLIKKYLDEGNNKDAPGNFPSWLVGKKPISMYMFDGDCFDIGTLDMYKKINEEYNSKD